MSSLRKRVFLWMKFTSIFWPKIDCLKFDLITTLTSIRDLPTSLTNGMTLNGKLISFVVRYLRGTHMKQTYWKRSDKIWKGTCVWSKANITWNIYVTIYNRQDGIPTSFLGSCLLCWQQCEQKKLKKSIITSCKLQNSIQYFSVTIPWTTIKMLGVSLGFLDVLQASFVHP